MSEEPKPEQTAESETIPVTADQALMLESLNALARTMRIIGDGLYQSANGLAEAISRFSEAAYYQLEAQKGDPDAESLVTWTVFDKARGASLGTFRDIEDIAAGHPLQIKGKTYQVLSVNLAHGRGRGRLVVQEIQQ